MKWKYSADKGRRNERNGMRWDGGVEAHKSPTPTQFSKFTRRDSTLNHPPRRAAQARDSPCLRDPLLTSLMQSRPATRPREAMHGRLEAGGWSHLSSMSLATRVVFTTGDRCTLDARRFFMLSVNLQRRLSVL
jgi:hypothetical protein